QALDVWLSKPNVKGGTNYRFFFLHWCIVFGKIIGIIWFALSTNGQPRSLNQRQGSLLFEKFGEV
ncbi:MAG: hypothetical protein K9M00_00005, partial [Candidatus Omnitrophica bacterium]|nr:hypothetical protein [Candidatus Omnitrophota bacterium]